MGDSPNYHNLGPPSINEQPNNHYNLDMLYCGFFVVVTAGLILAIYHCIALKCCTDYPSSWLRNPETGTSSQFNNGKKLKVMELESSLYKYRKKGSQEKDQEEECVVCLSVFEEGEDVRKLVRCNHCFHAPCIDMWLYSHFDCPLCRAPVGGCDGGGDTPEGYSGGTFSDSGDLPV